jgi:hypothetical protein
MEPSISPATATATAADAALATPESRRARQLAAIRALPIGVYAAQQGGQAAAAGALLSPVIFAYMTLNGMLEVRYGAAQAGLAGQAAAPRPPNTFAGLLGAGIRSGLGNTLRFAGWMGLTGAASALMAEGWRVGPRHSDQLRAGDGVWFVAGASTAGLFARSTVRLADGTPVRQTPVRMAAFFVAAGLMGAALPAAVAFAHGPYLERILQQQ